MKPFKSILEFQKEFNTQEKCRKFLELQRWNGTPACPFCGSINVCRFASGKIFKCRERGCRHQFSVTVGTVYENTKISLTKWFLATYILTVHSKGISSLQLASMINVTQRTAWHLTHRIREMLKDNDPVVLIGIVEVDETYVGGSLKNMHAKKKKSMKGMDNKTMVFGALKRDGKLRTRVITNTALENLTGTLEEFVAHDSSLMSDESNAYTKIGEKYNHKTVNHREKEYVRKEAKVSVHTNSIEGYWNILKKQIDGIHHFVSPKHLQRYCNESAFRYNNRKTFQDEKFAYALSNCNGTLPYKTLIGK